MKQQDLFATDTPVHFIWGNGDLVIQNPQPVLLKQLEYYHKSLEWNSQTYTRQVRKEKTFLYREVEPDMVTTFPGFLDMLVTTCHANHIPCTIDDRRARLPVPALSAAGDFINDQRSLFFQMLGQNRSGLCCAPTRYGKCLGPDEPVLMFDGSIKTAKEVQVGDRLMGPDSKPRTVKSTVTGQDEMVWIIPNKGRPWLCTHDHVLNLRCNYTEYHYLRGQTCNVTVDDYLQKSKNWKHLHKMWRTGVEFEEKAPVDSPYVAGIFVGDGSRYVNSINDGDPEVINTVIKWCHEKGFCFNPQPGSGCIEMRISDPNRDWMETGLVSQFRLQFLNSKMERVIPKTYLTASRQERLELLAGLLDTDGYCVNHWYYEIVTKYETLRDDILFLARSLGFSAYYSQKPVKLKTWDKPRIYQRIRIGGQVEEIPVRSQRFKLQRHNKHDSTNVGFEVQPAGVRPYAGFDLDGDGLFLLGDFTVTHNTMLLANMIRIYPGIRIVVTAPGVSLLTQLEEDLKRWCPGREILGLYTGSHNRKLSPDVTVVSMDSLEKCEPETVDLLLVDEPHECVSPSRLSIMTRFTRARVYGFGATVTGRFDGADKLITGVIGPVLVQKTFRDAVEEGAICPIIVYFIRLPFTPWDCSKRDAAYRALIFRNNHFNSLVETILNQCVPVDWQTLIFIDEIKQADLMEKLVTNGVTAIASRMDKDDRAANLEAMKSGELKRCIATNIYATGMTFPHLRVMFNAAGGGGSITATQKPGRLAQKMPGKKAGYVIDFLFEPSGQMSSSRGKKDLWRQVVQDGYNRISHYRQVGFETRLVNNIGEIKFE